MWIIYMNTITNILNHYTMNYLTMFTTNELITMINTINTHNEV